MISMAAEEVASSRVRPPRAPQGIEVSLQDGDQGPRAECVPSLVARLLNGRRPPLSRFLRRHFGVGTATPAGMVRGRDRPRARLWPSPAPFMVSWAVGRGSARSRLRLRCREGEQQWANLFCGAFSFLARGSPDGLLKQLRRNSALFSDQPWMSSASGSERLPASGLSSSRAAAVLLPLDFEA